MADRINAFKVTCIGGLNTNKDVLSQGEIEPGSAYALINYEPATIGGYRRISGYTNSYGTIPGTGPALGVGIVEDLNDNVFACRAPLTGTDYFYKWIESTEEWSAITTPATVTMSGVKKVRITKLRWSAVKAILTDGVNPAAVYDGTTYTQITSTNALSAPKYSAAFKNHLFLAGDPSEPYNLCFSSPLDELDYDTANGSGVINVGFEIVQIKQFRDILYIFGKNAIKSLVGNSVADFVLAEVTTNLGCLVPDSVIELGGNILFLGPDGFRPISGTQNVNDVGIETISKQIQFSLNLLISDIASGNIDPETLTAVAVRNKSQFRLLVPSDGIFGFLGGLRQGPNGIFYEFSQIFDLTATCASSGYVGLREVVLHGDTTGRVHKQEEGTSFDGNPILSVYQTPYYYFEDPTVRKNFYTVSTFLRSEGTAQIVLGVSYDFDDTQNVFNPANYTLNTTGAAAYYNEALYDTTATYDGNPSPVEKTTFSGSGFSVAFKYVTFDTNASHTIQGLVLNYAINDRR